MAVHTIESLQVLGLRGVQVMASGTQDTESVCKRPHALLGKADKWIPRGPGGGTSLAFGQQETKIYSQQPRPGQGSWPDPAPVSPVLAHVASPASTWPPASRPHTLWPSLPCALYASTQRTCTHASTGHSSLCVRSEDPKATVPGQILIGQPGSGDPSGPGQLRSWGQGSV